MQYLVVAELFSVRIRVFCTSIYMCAHFANQYGNSRVVPNILLLISSRDLGPRGTFWFFASVTILSSIWVWLSIPEIARRELENIDNLFALPWYKIGLYSNRDVVTRDANITEKELEAADHIEARGRLN